MVLIVKLTALVRVEVIVLLPVVIVVTTIPPAPPEEVADAPVPEATPVSPGPVAVPLASSADVAAPALGVEDDATFHLR